MSIYKDCDIRGIYPSEIDAGAARRIVPETYSLEFEGGRVIDIDAVIDIEGELFNALSF